MCGIVGYTGEMDAGPVLLKGLTRLEYRGYDSAGLAVYDDSKGDFVVVKSRGRLTALSAKTDCGRSLDGHCGIGHTRWATHGEPNETNAHPHYSDDGNVVGVHNGIIENYQELRDKLRDRGYSFYSETDTEVAIKLIDYYYKKYLGTPVDAINHALVRIRGAYGLAVMFKDYPGEIYAARKDSPLIAATSEKGNFIASDASAFLEYSKTVYYLDSYELCRVTPDEIEFFDLNGDKIEIEPVTIDWDAQAADKCGYEHFMIKEIHEQPRAVKDTLDAYVREGKTDLSSTGLSDSKLASYRRIYIVACGSAYHVGVAARYIFEELAAVPTDIDIASEFRYRHPLIEENSLMIVISQSGETADTLAALRMAKQSGTDTLAIVNVVGSSIAREADYVMYTQVGPEIAVATTKAYSSQLICSYLIAIRIALLKSRIGEEQSAAYMKELYTIPRKIQTVIDDRTRIQKFATRIALLHDVFFIGRGIDYAIGLEGSLKLKEVSYIHSEGYAAGELKHGPISLIDDGTLVIGIATQDSLYEKIITNIEEVKSRGAFLMGITLSGHFGIEKSVDFPVYIPKTDPYFTASLAIVPLQLLAYYVSVNKGIDVDKPKNLAKSVTVE